MAAGAIPWDKIRDYADHLGLSPSMAITFCEVIRGMDNVWMLDQARKIEAQAGS